MRGAHSTCACVRPCSQTSRAHSSFARNVPSQVLQSCSRDGASSSPSINIRTVRARTTTTAARTVAHASPAHVPSEIAHCLSSRPTLTHSLACVAKRAATDHTSSAQRRADELLACGASRTLSRTTTAPAARSEPGQRASSSAWHDGGDHHPWHVRCNVSMWDCERAPRTGLCGACA